MTPEMIERILMQGEVKSRLVTDEVGRILTLHPEYFDTVFDLMLSDSDETRMRAATVVLKVGRKQKHLLRERKSRILDELLLLNHLQVNWMTARMMADLIYTTEEAERAFRRLKEFITQPKIALRAGCIEAMTTIALQHPRYKKETIKAINQVLTTGSAGELNIGKRMLAVLDKKEAKQVTRKKKIL
ncbi:MAG: hypothetical protein AMXMBFR48_29540 [Ignavibacteriales bacterium]